MPPPIAGLRGSGGGFANPPRKRVQYGMLLGSAAELFMPQLLAALDQAGDGQACSALLHGSRYQVDAHSMGKDTRSRGRLIIFKPAPAALTDREKTA
jgi:hypothetical protein